MPMKAPVTEQEQERLEALRDYRILDTPPERAIECVPTARLSRLMSAGG